MSTSTSTTTTTTTTYRNCTHVVKTHLLDGKLTYKEIANQARKHFPQARTTDKSVASIARDMRKTGVLQKRTPVRKYPVQLELDI